jgi:hypothetical protein
VTLKITFPVDYTPIQADPLQATNFNFSLVSGVCDAGGVLPAWVHIENITSVAGPATEAYVVVRIPASRNYTSDQVAAVGQGITDAPNQAFSGLRALFNFAGSITAEVLSIEAGERTWSYTYSPVGLGVGLGVGLALLLAGTGLTIWFCMGQKKKRAAANLASELSNKKAGGAAAAAAPAGAATEGTGAAAGAPVVEAEITINTEPVREKAHVQTKEEEITAE